MTEEDAARLHAKLAEQGIVTPEGRQAAAAAQLGRILREAEKQEHAKTLPPAKDAAPMADVVYEDVTAEDVAAIKRGFASRDHPA